MPNGRAASAAAAPRLTRLSLRDFRCYEEAELHFPAGVTLVVGANAQGKTSLLEAVAWAATGSSFRGVPDAVLVRAGCDSAIVRAEVVDGARAQLLEAEIRASGRNRVRLNDHPLTKARERRELVRVTVFAPDDLQLVKGGPAERRAYLDGLLTSVAPRYEAVIADYDRVLRQRNALLKQRFGSDPDDETTMKVFDAQLARTGAELTRGRWRMLERLVPLVAEAYDELAHQPDAVDAGYQSEWALSGAADADADAERDLETALLEALTARRRAELDRKVTLAGPHRDEWRLRVGGLDARTHASQGEQRTLALALRLGGHRLCTEVIGSAPVLLLDDVFSELDPQRSAALVANLGSGQTLLTTAGDVPDGVRADHVLRVDAGVVRAAA
ncbi:MAG TPA: DNA replication/repair protein RecF [Acidimicrobiia bacterium]|nr:DNA replication/repair protein RecF [Acidimicrobiia bacterium]